MKYNACSHTSREILAEEGDDLRCTYCQNPMGVTGNRGTFKNFKAQQLHLAESRGRVSPSFDSNFKSNWFVSDSRVVAPNGIRFGPTSAELAITVMMDQAQQ